ncbi:uncharacterized protein LOC108023748 [Drosophila biarmipes]|uniref:uncharacterized protein LOC108023748 n=1 Tax=Drosophila biarmipes TaxID=125945 RepID=UPI0021CCE16D|nr:uncharacterized protein LOC108023748 [Drosophila biarmipes]
MSGEMIGARYGHVSHGVANGLRFRSPASRVGTQGEKMPKMVSPRGIFTVHLSTSLYQKTLRFFLCSCFPPPEVQPISGLIELQSSMELIYSQSYVSIVFY